MPTAYTPGLTVAAATLVHKERLLPISGEVLVTVGQQVAAETPIARAVRPGNLTTIKVSERLGIDPAEVPSAMRKSQGDAVEAGEVIAETRSFFGLFHATCASPVKGVIEHISPRSGYVGIRGEPVPLETVAHISGRVSQVIEGRGAVIEARAALVQGIFGVGGERRGVLRVACNGPEGGLDISVAEGGARGAVLVAGWAYRESLAAAAQAGAVGVVSGGINDADLRAFVGYEIGVAVTGQERVPLTLIITEGFGGISMARRTFELLAALAGKQASIDGATQIRAGVIRPEVIVPLAASAEAVDAPQAGGRAEGAPQLAPGVQVRLIREPHFGRLAVVTALPTEPQEIETEARVRVVEVDLGEGQRVLVPRANVEMVYG